MSKAQNSRLERNLAFYTLAAAATLSAGHQAQAEVVFTPSNLKFTGSPIYLDIDNDGAFDFVMWSRYSGCTSTFRCSGSWGVARAGSASPKNGVAANRRTGDEAALIRGNNIGRPQDDFGGGVMGGFSQSGDFGSWSNVTDRYLGIRLIIDGEVHYGWIGFLQTRDFQAKFSGWAYETEPNTSIRAGQRTGTADSWLAEGSENTTSLRLRAGGHVSQTALRNRVGK